MRVRLAFSCAEGRRRRRSQARRGWRRWRSSNAGVSARMLEEEEGGSLNREMHQMERTLLSMEAEGCKVCVSAGTASVWSFSDALSAVTLLQPCFSSARQLLLTARTSELKPVELPTLQQFYVMLSMYSSVKLSFLHLVYLEWYISSVLEHLYWQ